MRDETDSGILLPQGETGSGLLHGVLSETAEAFDTELRGAKLPSDGRVFRKTYGDALVRFEVARIASRQRVAIARKLALTTLGRLRLGEDGRTAPLEEALARPLDAPAVETCVVPGAPGLRAEVPCDGHIHRGAEVLDLVDRLHAQCHLTDAARDGLRWILRHIEKQGGALDLRGQRFALLGAGAELSPARMLLAAGATVLWVDLAPPAPGLTVHSGGGGTLVHAPGGADLLGAPRNVAASIRRFAASGPVHLGLYAYAPGASRELRIAAGMHAIVRSLGPEVVRSVSLLVSPTSPGEMQGPDLLEQEARRRRPALWQRVMQAGRALRGPGHYGARSGPVCRAVMSIQGAGYQAAQYLAKIAAAETLAVDGLGEGGAPITVSANVAGITATRSLSHPLFQVAFAGAPAFGVRIFEPATTRALSGLLMLHDLLNPHAPGAAERTVHSRDERARSVRAAQIHGGVHVVPWGFESAVQAAALVGSMRRPDLLLALGRSAAGAGRPGPRAS